MKVTLLFPPAADVRSPHLAIPALAAYLRNNGVRVDVRDLNLDGLLSVLRPAVVRQAVSACARRDTWASNEEEQEVAALLRSAEFILEHVEFAITDLRDPATFFDPHRHQLARACILGALQLVSAAHPTVSYSISAKYAVDGIDPSRLNDLEAVTADRRSNLFADLYESIAAELDASPPHVVGISILNGQQIIPGLTLARTLKNRGHFVVIGGTVYAKFATQLTARPRFFELFCHGVFPYEGETGLLTLVERLEKGASLEDIPNFIQLNEAGRPTLGPSHVEDVNALPTPDFDGLPLGQYLSPAPVLPILLGKGCYYNRCKFCDIPFINSVADSPYRRRDAALVAGDVATLQRHHGVRHFELTDETLSPRDLLRLGDALETHPEVDARFVGYARLEPGFTPDACERLHAMGVRKLFFGLESGSQATLDHMRKGIRLDVATRTLENVMAAGIGVHVFSIIGFPEETEPSARDTLDFFVSRRDLFNRPWHSFDIHPFGLDLRTEYGDEPTRYGIEIDAAHLESRDFPITVKHWKNTRGLDHERVAALLAEFHERLAANFPYHNYAQSLWPSFEEYAVLYADDYEHRLFEWRLTLPPAGSPARFRLMWAPDVSVQAGAEGYDVSSLSGRTVVGELALRLLADPPEATDCDGLLELLAGAVDHDREQHAELIAELRVAIDRLLAARTMWLVPEPTVLDLRAAGYVTGRAAEPAVSSRHP